MGTRSTPILKGASLADSLVSGGFTYYGFTRSDDSWVMMRVNSAETEYRYSVGSPNSKKDRKSYADAFAVVTTLTYATPDKYNY